MRSAKAFIFFLLPALLALPARAQNYTNVTASNIQDVTGHPLMSGSMCWQGVSPSGQPINFTAGGGGVVVRSGILGCVGISNGAIVGALNVPNPEHTSPQGILYHVTVFQGDSEVLDFPQVGFEGASFDFDLYSPGPAPVPWGGGTVNGNQTVNGDLAVTGNVTCGSGCSGGSGGGGVNVQSSSYAAVAGDAGKLVSFNCSSACTLTLPSSPPSSTWYVATESIGAGTLTISPNGLQLDASSSSATASTGQGMWIFTNGSNYFTERGIGGNGGGSMFYQTIDANGSAQTERSALNFSLNFALSDSSSPSRTTVDLASTINKSTTGNAATATAAASTPGLCAAGKVPNGILPSFNAANCQPLSTLGDISPIAFGAKFDSQFAYPVTLNGTTTVASNATAILGATIVSAGSGYAVNDVLAVPGGASGTIKVLSVSSGAIATYSVLAGGIGYTNLPYTPISVTGGAGTGATFLITVSGNPAFNSSTDAGKNIYGTCGYDELSTTRDLPLGTIVSVSDAQHVTVSNAATGSCSVAAVIWGTDDTAALLAWASTMKCYNQQVPEVNSLPRFVMPSGGTMFHQKIFDGPKICGTHGGGFGGTLLGAGQFSTWLYPMPNFSSSGMVANATNGLFFDSGETLGMDEMGGFAIDGNGIDFSSVFGYNSGSAINPGSAHYFHDVAVLDTDLFAGAIYWEASTNVTEVNTWTANNYSSNSCIENYGDTQEFIRIGGINTNDRTPGLCIGNANGNPLIPSHFVIKGWVKDEDGAQPCILITNSVNVSIEDSVSYCDVSVDGTSEVWLKNFYSGSFNNDRADATGLTIASGGKVHASGSTFQGRGAGHAVNNAGSFYDEGDNSLTGTVPSFTGSGSIFGSASITGSKQTSGNIALSSGWGSSAAASAAAGDSRVEQFTITANGTTAASPTVTVTFPSPFFSAPTACAMTMVGGTGTSTPFSTGSVSSTSAAFTFAGTPSNGSTYTVQMRCSN